MLKATQDDWNRCETLIRALLSDEQMQVLDGYPVWELHPPQREEHDTPESYAKATYDYTKRVLDRGSNNSDQERA